MRTIQEIYPDLSPEHFEPPTNYQPLLDSFEYGILLQVDEGDYRGDSMVLFQDTRQRYGILLFGWGTCPGCDGLQQCESIQDIEELRDWLHNQFHWFDDLLPMMAWLMADDRKYEWPFQTTLWSRFVQAVEALALPVDAPENGDGERGDG